MKKNLLKTATASLAVLMLLSACGETSAPSSSSQSMASTSSQGTTSAATNNLTEPGTFPIVNEMVELDVYVGAESFIKDFENNELTKYAEELTNVHINWTVGQQGANDKMNLMLSGGGDDLPDMFVGNRIMPITQAITYGERGLLLDLSEIVAEQGFYINKYMENEPQKAQAAYSNDGKLYGIQSFSETFHTKGQHKMWINQAWLDNVGKDMPTTTEEFYDVLKAFKEQDANGNGDPNDEIPLIASKNAWRSDLTGFLMNPFQLTTGKDFKHQYVDAAGMVQYAYMQDGFKDGLAYLNMLSEEGLMDEESLSLDSAQLKMLTADPNGNRVGAVPAGAINEFLDIEDAELRDQFVTVPALIGPTGLQQVADITGNNTNYSAVITSSCETPEVAVRWLDAFMAVPTEDMEVFMPLHYGLKGVGWDDPTEGSKGLDGQPALYDVNITSGEVSTEWWGLMDPKYFPAEFRNGQQVSDEWSLEKLLYAETEKNYAPHFVTCFVEPYLVDEDNAADIAEIQTVLNSYVDESVAKFIMGTWSVEEDWDNFQEELVNIGAQDVLDTIQVAYDLRYPR